MTRLLLLFRVPREVLLDEARTALIVIAAACLLGLALRGNAVSGAQAGDLVVIEGRR